MTDDQARRTVGQGPSWYSDDGTDEPNGATTVSTGRVWVSTDCNHRCVLVRARKLFTSAWAWLAAKYSPWHACAWIEAILRLQ